MNDPWSEPEPALGVVVDVGRGSVPWALVHGESLMAAASWALGEAGITPIDASVPWSSVREAGEPFVLHDVACPMTPPGFLAACVARATDEDVVVVGVRSVTDTVKRVVDGRIGATVDRESLLVVASPVVLPARVCAAMVESPVGADFTDLVRDLAADGIAYEVAPPEARRVASADDVRLLEALTAR